MPRPLHWITDKGIASKKVLKPRATDKYLPLENYRDYFFFFFNLVWWYEIDDNDNDDDDDDDEDDEDSNGYPATGAQGQGFILCQKELTLLKSARHAHSTHPY